MKGYTNQVCEMDFLRELNYKVTNLNRIVNGFVDGTGLPISVVNLFNRVAALENNAKNTPVKSGIDTAESIIERDVTDNACPVKECPKMKEMMNNISVIRAECTSMKHSIDELHKKVAKHADAINDIDRLKNDVSNVIAKCLVTDSVDHSIGTDETTINDKPIADQVDKINDMIDKRFEQFRKQIDTEVDNKIDGELILLEERINKKLVELKSLIDDDGNDTIMEEESYTEEDIDDVIED